MLTRYENKMVLVTGGAGYIGSHMVKLLQESGYFPIVLDNLSSGTRESLNETIPFYFGDVGDKEIIKMIYKAHPFTAVMHFAAFIQVGESVKKPLEYYRNNVVSTINLFETLKELNVRNIVFSSSAAVYGQPSSLGIKIDEKHPKSPINPYGQTKLVIEDMLKFWSQSDSKLNAICLRYFNVAGFDPAIKKPDCQIPPANLIPIILQKIKKNEALTVFGNDYKTEDGTCIRDYIHVKDICSAHLLALNAILQEKFTGYLPLNLGTGNGHSVLKVIKTTEKIVGKKINFEIGSRRDGDPAFLVADGELAKSLLKWNPSYSDLTTIIGDAWKAELNTHFTSSGKTKHFETFFPVAPQLKETAEVKDKSLSKVNLLSPSI